MKAAIADLKNLVSVPVVVNTEPVPIYTPTGNPTFQRNAINTDVFADEEMSQKLSKIINDKYNGPTEKQFLTQMDIADVPRTHETTVIPVKEKPIEIDLAAQYVDDALIMYRAKKLHQRHMSNDEILQKLKDLLLFDASHNTNKDKLNSSELEERFKKKNSVFAEQFQKFSEEHSDVSDSQEMHFDDTNIDIEAQRREAIGAYEYKEETSSQPLSSNSFSEQELKYIKTDVSSSPSAKAKNDKSNNGVGIDTAEVSRKIHSSMTPEQIEKLRKLGIKI